MTLTILLAVDIRPVGSFELFKLAKLTGMTAGFMINRCIDDWFHQVTLLFTFCADEVISDLLLICVCPFLKNIQLIPSRRWATIALSRSLILKPSMNTGSKSKATWPASTARM